MDIPQASGRLVSVGGADTNFLTASLIIPNTGEVYVVPTKPYSALELCIVSSAAQKIRIHEHDPDGNNEEIYEMNGGAVLTVDAPYVGEIRTRPLHRYTLEMDGAATVSFTLVERHDA